MLPATKQIPASVVFVPEDIPDDFDAMQATYRRNFSRLRACDRGAESRGDIVGRYFRETVADGFAYYIVSDELPYGWVKIRLVHGVGTDTPASYFGEEAVILQNLALSRIKHRYSQDQSLV
ncbi:MAG: hypothetical protein ACYC9J_11660 [Sulfuricaulis sp.]